MVSGGLGLFRELLHHLARGYGMRSESTHQPTHTPTDSLFRPTRAPLPTTDSMGRPELLRQVSRRQDHRDLGTRGERLAQMPYGHGDRALRFAGAQLATAYRHHRTERADLNF